MIDNNDLNLDRKFGVGDSDVSSSNDSDSSSDGDPLDTE